MAKPIDPNGYDYVRNKRGDNDIDVGDGGSTIITGRGDDTITAGDGYDYVNAGKGDNEISVGDGGSYIISGRGDDVIVSEDGYDIIRAGGGNNSVNVGDGGSFIQTGGGDDTIRAGEGYDRVFTKGGDNDIDLGDGGSKVLAGSGDDTIKTGDGWDFVSAGHGDNQIDIGSGGGIVLSGRGADDVTLGSSGYSFVHTGSGDDTVTYTAEDSLHFSRLYGGNGQDTLVLDLPLELYKDSHFQSEIAYYLEFKAPAGKPFYFCSLNLYVHSFEAVEVVVDGVAFDPVDQAVSAVEDTATVREDDGAVLQGSVLDNDSTPNGFDSVTLISGPDKGVLVLNDDGSYAFDPDGAFDDLAEGETTEVTFTYEVKDIDGDAAQATVTITIIGDNDTPFLAEGTLEAAEDGGTVGLDLAALGGDIDSDDDGASLTYEISSGPANGTAEIVDSTLVFSPGSGFQDLAVGESRDVTVTVTATDRHGAQVSADYTITVNGTNDGPLAVADINTDDAVVEEGSSVVGDATAEGNVLSNDSDVDTSDTLQVTSVTAGGAAGIGGVGTSVAGTYGAVIIGADGSYTYTLDNTLAATDALAPGEVVTDVFHYEVSDGNGGTASATLTISITGSEDNRPPVAQADAVTIGETDIIGPNDDATVAFNLLADNGSGADSDPDGDTLTVQSAGGAPAGTSFSVTTTSAIAAFSGLTLSAAVAANGDVSLDTQDAGGPFLFDGLSGGQSASVTFEYTIADPSGETSTASATITIEGTEDAPEISGTTTADVAEDGTQTATGQLSVTDADLADNPEFIADSTPGSFGTFSIDAAGTWTYTLDNDAAQALAQDETVEEVFTVTATTADGESVQTSFTVTVTGQEDAPIISGQDAGTVVEDTTPSTSGSLVATDADGADTPAFIAQSGTDGSYGSFSIDTAGNWSYTLGSQAQGLGAGDAVTEVFTVSATTADGETTSTDVTIQVNGTNDAPIAAPLSAEVNENISDFAGFSGFTGEALIPNSNYFYVVDYETGEVTEVPNTLGDFNQANAIAAYAPTNGLLVNVNPNNSNFEIAVVAMVNGVATNVDVSDFTLSGTYEGATTTRSAVGFEYFQFLDGADGAEIALTLSNANSQNGPTDVTITLLDAFFYDDVSDELFISSFLVDVVASQDPDVVTVTADFTDIDLNDNHSFSVDVDTNNTQGAVTNNGDGTFTYSTNGAFEYLSVGEQATDTFEYTVDDGQGGTSTETVTITVTGTNDVPVAQPGAATVEESGSNSLSVLPLVTELDLNDAPFYFIDDSFVQGSVTDNFDGTFEYDPAGAFDYLAKGETAEDVLVYVVDDGNGGFTFNTFTITIEGSNELPVVTGTQSVTTNEDAGSVSLSLLANASDANGDAIDVSELNVTTSDGRPVAFHYDANTDVVTLDPTQFGDLGVGESLDVSVSYNVIEIDRAYSGGDDAPRALTNPGTFYFSDVDGGELHIVERGVSGVNTFEDALSALESNGINIANGVAILIDENGGATSGVAVSSRIISDGDVSLAEADVTLEGYTGGVREGTTTPPNFITFYEAFDPTTLTVTIDRPDLRCGPTEHTFTINEITQAADKDVEFASMTLDVVPEGATVTEIITVDGVNDSPEISGADVETDANTAINLDLVTDATDEDGDTVTVGSVSQGTNGTVAIEADGTVTYTPDAGFSGEDSFTYTATDGNGGEVTETVTVTVMSSNTAPLAADVAVDAFEETPIEYTGSFNETSAPDAGRWYIIDFDTGVASTVLGNTDDLLTADQVAGQFLANGNGAVVTVNANAQGWLLAAYAFVDGVGTGLDREAWDITATFGGDFFRGPLDPSDPSAFPEILAFDDNIRFWPAAQANFEGLELSDGRVVNTQFILRDIDNEFNSDADVEVRNIRLEAQVTPAPTPVTINADIVDPDLGDTQTITIDTTGTQCEVVNNGDGTFSYEVTDVFEFLEEGETATDTFTYTVEDSAGATDTATVTVTVNGSDEPEIFSSALKSDTYTFVGSEYEGLRLNPLENDLFGGRLTSITSNPESSAYDLIEANRVTSTEFELRSNAVSGSAFNAIDALDEGETAVLELSYATDAALNGLDRGTITIVFEGIDDDPIVDQRTDIVVDFVTDGGQPFSGTSSYGFLNLPENTTGTGNLIEDPDDEYVSFELLSVDVPLGPTGDFSDNFFNFTNEGFDFSFSAEDMIPRAEYHFFDLEIEATSIDGDVVTIDHRVELQFKFNYYYY